MVKISDVARHAGVSPSTVSYVLSGKRSISDQTRRRVMDSIRALGYRPHAGARALASNRSNVIALVVPLRSGIHVPIVMQMVIAAVTTARTYDHDVLLLTQDEGVGGLERVAGSALVDAILVMDVEMHDVRLPVLRSLDRPSVLIGFPADPSGLTCIDWDFEAAGAACAEHLADLGHREIALIGAPPAVYERGTGFAERTKAGFQRAAAERGVHAVVRPCDPEHARETAADLLRDHPGLTGIAVHNEPAVEPLLTAFRASGRRIPDDLSVIAIGPDDLAARLELTSISIPAEELGRQAVALLMDKLNGDQAPGATLLPSRLVARSSTPAA
ncbi:LacI family DNA-binding transcriptional regulator [Actinoallomurus vinaceus]|uniref:LacI family DNA-binding transcriptional regulator n=1 Tax=Actinoallomurus vinaceus TaxID=1080074 RepID=A0ABP8UIW9_9ACTN